MIICDTQVERETSQIEAKSYLQSCHARQVTGDIGSPIFDSKGYK
jgi:hypothetical protein